MTKKIILASGPPGCQRHEYLQKVIKSENTQYYRAFEVIREIGREKNLNITVKNISTHDNLAELREKAFEEISQRIEKSDKKFHIISTPAVFYHKDWSKEEGITAKSIRTLKPDIIIIFIDDLLEVKKRLKEHERWKLEFPKGASLSFLTKWRGDSMSFLMRMYGRHFLEPGEPKSENSFVKKIYIYGRQHPPSTLHNLIYNERMPKMYLSYPITGARDQIDDLRKFRNKLANDFIVFDPYTIRDWDIVHESDQRAGETVTINGVTLDRVEIERAIDSIRSQIVIRDFSIIASVDFVVVRHHSKKPSSGVMAEIVYAQQKAKPVFGIYPFNKRPSPFLEYFVKWGNISTLFTSSNLDSGYDSPKENLFQLEDLLVEKLKTFKDDLKKRGF